MLRPLEMTVATTNPTRESAFVWICGSFLISANETRISREDFFGSGRTSTGGVEIATDQTRIYGSTVSVHKSKKFGPMLKIEILNRPPTSKPQCQNEWNLKILTKQYTFLRGGGNHIF